MKVCLYGRPFLIYFLGDKFVSSYQGSISSQCGYPIRAVPSGKLLKVGGKGMVFADAA